MSQTAPRPALADAVLAACDAEDWTAAAQALSEHGDWLRSEIAAGRLRNEGELAGLLASQQALGEELARRRDACASEIGQLTQAGRGARAYRDDSGG
jgi:hypothetical protein